MFMLPSYHLRYSIIMMKHLWVYGHTILVLCLSGVGVAAEPVCMDHSCRSARYVTQAQYQTLPSGLVHTLQQQFNGRVVSVGPPSGPCKEIRQEITIGGQVEVGIQTACQFPTGAWKTGNFYDVQILTPHQKLIVITVDASTGEIFHVYE